VKFTIVTPSYNQGAFVERTVESVVSQRGDFELEYLVVDGGSTDGTLDVLRRYEGRLRFVSERDRGQSDAINKGFRAATGDVVAWLNSDDTYAPRAAVEALHSLYVGAQLERRHLSPQDLGVKEIGHFGFFKESFRSTLWEQLGEFVFKRASPLPNPLPLGERETGQT